MPFLRSHRCLLALRYSIWVWVLNGFTRLLQILAQEPMVDSESSTTRPLPPAEAASGWTLPSGFKMTVFAAEPEVRQPIAMAFDPRGRLWVAENYTYAEAAVKFATNLSDRILIFEDTDGDGHFDSRTVFPVETKILTSLETGLGGAWLLCPPQLLFVPDRNGDDLPDGPPEVILDGFGTTLGNHHTLANGLRWGPDGWLWGRVGISSPTRIGRPGDPESKRCILSGGLWRYNPQTQVVEVVSHGTTNPWGHDWNVEGEPFFINTVIGHLWHAIPGAHFRRMHGDDPLPNIYSPIDQHADHYHFDTGTGWTHSRADLSGGRPAASSDLLGGGHAHSGLLIYQGGNWPAAYEGALLTLNFHGRRINRERVERQGSGYTGRHAPDFGQSSDPWFRGIDLIQGPDGSVYIADWSDTGECHEHDGVHRNSGRILRLTYSNTPPLAPLSIPLKVESNQLVDWQFGPSEWHRRQARSLLRDRAANGTLEPTVVDRLLSRLSTDSSRLGKLRALWALLATRRATPDLLRRLLRDSDEHIRSWAVRLLSEERPEPSALTLNDWVKLARIETSALVRLYLAAALNRVPVEGRFPLAGALLTHGADDIDHNQGPMLWFALEPCVALDPTAAVTLAVDSQIHLVRQNIARRLAQDLPSFSKHLGSLLRSSADAPPSHQTDVLTGLVTALPAAKNPLPPEAWALASARFAKSDEPRVRELNQRLAALFGDEHAINSLRQIIADPRASATTRHAALTSLIEARPVGLVDMLEPHLTDPVLSGPALVATVSLGTPKILSLAIQQCLILPPNDRIRVLNALVTRVPSATQLIEAIETGRVPKTYLTPDLARLVANLGHAPLRARLLSITAPLRVAPAKGLQSIESFRSELLPVLAKANLSEGHRHFQNLCASCHVLYGEGGVLGPDLSGSGRASLDYLLAHIVDPNAVVAPDFRWTLLELKDGRTLSGLLREISQNTVTLLSVEGRTVLSRLEILRQETRSESMMPEGLLDSLQPVQRRDLIGYLMHPQQVSLPSSP